jgi:hypothetical protein
MKATGFDIAFISDRFSFKEQLIESYGFIGATGIKNADIEADIFLNAYSSRQGRAIIDIKVTRAKVSLPSDELDITAHGNYFGHLAGALKAVFKKELGAKIEAEIEQLIKSALPRALNQQVEAAQTQIKVSDKIKFDSHLADFPLAIVDGWFYFGLKGFGYIDPTKNWTSISQDLCEDFNNQQNHTSYSEPETFRAYFSDVDDEVAGEILDFVKQVKWDNDLKVNFFNLFQLTEFGSEEMSDNIKYVTATAGRVADYDHIVNKYPRNQGFSKSSFWIEHLNKNDKYLIK